MPVARQGHVQYCISRRLYKRDFALLCGSLLPQSRHATDFTQMNDDLREPTYVRTYVLQIGAHNIDRRRLRNPCFVSCRHSFKTEASTTSNAVYQPGDARRCSEWPGKSLQGPKTLQAIVNLTSSRPWATMQLSLSTHDSLSRVEECHSEDIVITLVKAQVIDLSYNP